MGGGCPLYPHSAVELPLKKIKKKKHTNYRNQKENSNSGFSFAKFKIRLQTLTNKVEDQSKHSVMFWWNASVLNDFHSQNGYFQCYE